MTDGGDGSVRGGCEPPYSDTVTVTFVTNHEVDPGDIDLRYNDLRSQLVPAIVNGTARPQEVLGTTEDALEKIRRKVREAKHGSE